MRRARGCRVCGLPPGRVAGLLVIGLLVAVARHSAESARADEPAATPADQETLLKRIAELSQDPERDMWMRPKAYRKIVLGRRGEQIAKIDELLKRFPETPAAEMVLEYKTESLFAIATLTQQPPTELKALVEEILAGQPGRSLEGTASFWKFKVDVYEKSAAGASEEELVAFRKQGLAHLADKYPENKNFGDAVLGNMIQVRLMEGRIEKAREYYEALKTHHPDSPLIEPLSGEFWRREALAKPFELEFTDLRGHKVDVSKMRGKVVLVEFWASWCVPCVISVPELKHLYNKYHNQGLEVVGVNLDVQRQQLEGFLRANKIPWPQYFDGQAWNSPLAKKYRVTAVPTMFLVDKKGILRSMDVQGRLESEITRLLAE